MQYFVVRLKGYNESQQENGKMKIIKEHVSYVVKCNDIPQAHEMVKAVAKLTFDDFEIKNASKLNVVDVLYADEIK